MKRLAILFIILFTPFMVVHALSLRANAPTRYVVKPGDSLYEIALRYLNKPWQWRQLWRANPSIKNPNLIYPGDVLVLSTVNGKPVLRSIGRGGRVKLSPQMRIESINEAIPTIPYSDIGPFLRGLQVVSPEVMQDAAYIIAAGDDRVVAKETGKIYVMDVRTPERRSYEIFRAGLVYENPKTKQVLGVEAIDVGKAQLVTFAQPATMAIVGMKEEVMRGDKVLPTPPELPNLNFFPRAPGREINGEIISLVDNGTVLSQHQIGVVDKGKVDGIKRGDVLAIYKPGRTVRDPRVNNRHFKIHKANVNLPDERVGEMIIFRVFKNVSFGLILNSEVSINKYDIVTNP